jgi:antitoxin HicB
MKTIDDYLRLPYHVVLTVDQDEDGNSGWVAAVEELPGCFSQGVTPNDAVDRVFDAMQGWISVALEDGREIPEPRAEPSHSGKFVVRMPVSLHALLAEEANREGVSLNQFVIATLAGAVGWRHQTRERTYAD